DGMSRRRSLIDRKRCIRVGIHVLPPCLPEIANAIVVASKPLVGTFAASQQAIPCSPTLDTALLGLPSFPILRQISAVLGPVQHPMLVAYIGDFTGIAAEKCVPRLKKRCVGPQRDLPFDQ